MSRITVQDLKRHTGVTDKQLNLQCLDQHFEQVARNVPNWLSLAMTLDLKEYQQQAIRMDLQLDYLYKTVEVLKVWKKNSGQEATYLRLVQACLEMSNALLAGEVCTLAKSATASPHSLEGWFREVGLMDGDIEAITRAGFATKQAFNLLTVTELNNLHLTRGGVRLLQQYVKANEDRVSSSNDSGSQAMSGSNISVPCATKYLNANEHLRHIVSLTYATRTKWFNIGLQLGLAKDVLDSIERNRSLHEDGDYFREVLTRWMQEGSAKMEDFLDVLEGPSVGMLDVARQVRDLDNEKKRQIGL